MNSTPKCVTETLELEAAREEIADILSDAKRCDDNYGVKPGLGKAAIGIENTNSADNGAVDFCNQALGSYEKSLDYINNNPLKTVQAIGKSLQRLREGKAEERCK